MDVVKSIFSLKYNSSYFINFRLLNLYKLTAINFLIYIKKNI